MTGPDRRIRFRVNIGDVIAHGTDLHGDSVNIAARLEAECPVGGICVSRAVRDHVLKRLVLVFDGVAVLPFQDMSGNRKQEYFAGGVADDIITELSRNHALFVIARNSSFTYKGHAVDVKQVARELGVRYVLVGRCAVRQPVYRSMPN